ncbi:expressed unknown protein [Seminavis robusta]|uniref:Uncharacterized protein n=1 Tax=Seminavis robusta TaxID=568900 RepID=A0A9N8DZZ3_9STRA|nr:expressed unknown protein [Seminavis robusta]|eukprot:Sro412_g137860.1 n/a (241) ;mRNA; r:29663-30385
MSSNKWTCQACGCFTNTISDKKCSICGRDRPAAAGATANNSADAGAQVDQPTQNNEAPFKLRFQVHDDLSGDYFTNKIYISPIECAGLFHRAPHANYFKDRDAYPYRPSHLVRINGNKPFVVSSGSSVKQNMVVSMRKLQREIANIGPGEIVTLTPYQPYPPNRLRKIVFSARPAPESSERHVLDTDVMAQELHRVLQDQVWAVGQVMLWNFGFAFFLAFGACANSSMHTVKGFSHLPHM